MKKNLKKLHYSLSRAGRWLFRYRDVFLVLAVLVFAGLTHGWNMTHFPYFENDEAAYFSQAWSFLSQGKLAPYTYWYDHAPFGWIFTSGWIAVTGGLFRFGFSLNSARVFMLLIHLASTFLLYRAAKKITNSSMAAVLTIVLFSISPLAVYFQRRLLLDNLMTFWLLLSLDFILYAKQRFWFFLLSALFFGLATLSKENGIFFLPVFFVLVLTQSHPAQRLLVGFQWLATAGMVIAFYPLYAILNQELFPSGTLLGGVNPHVSLLQTLRAQASRGTGLPFWNTDSDFLYNYVAWLNRDMYFIVGGTLAFLIQAIVAIWHKPSRVIFFLTLSMLAFLMSGKLVINFYVIPLIPLFALCMSYTVALFINLISWRKKLIQAILFLLVLASVGRHYAQNISVQGMFKNDETTDQVLAIDWVKSHVPADSHIVMDYYGNLDLKNARFAGDPVFPNADWYWKVDFDPDIREKKLHNNSKNIDYILMTPQLFSDVHGYSFTKPLTQDALKNSSEVAYFGPPYAQQDTLSAFVANHPNGDWVAVQHQNTLNDILKMSWESYKIHFITAEGQVLDPRTHKTESREVGYTLLRAVLSNDQETFQKVWNWTYANLALKDKLLFSSSYTNAVGGKKPVIDPNTTSDGDEFIAYALALAGKKWSVVGYQTAAQTMVQNIWQYETIPVGTHRYVVAGTWTAQLGRDKFTLNPSEMTPLFYQAFAKIDPQNDWRKLRTEMYAVLDQCSTSTPSGTFVPPNWCNVGKDNKVSVATEIDVHANDYSYEAFRLMWNVGVEARTSNSPEAPAALNKFSLLASDWKNRGKIFVRYTHDGTPAGKEESLDQYSSAMSYFVGRGETAVAQDIYDKQITPGFQQHQNNAYWGDPQSVFQQNWNWLNVWLLRGNLEAVTF